MAQTETDNKSDNRQSVALPENAADEFVKDVVRFTESTTDSSSSSSSSSSSENSYPSPPDGGWGWVIVCASFVAFMIADGFQASVGILYAEFLEYFGASKLETSWIGSLFVSMPALCGPIASILTNHLGCRRTTIAGGIIACFGCVLASFSNSIATLCLSFGVIAGFGLSLVYMPAVIIVAFYFEKKRALATGIAVAGSGLGAFFCAPLTELLIDTYGWRGALIIIGGLILNIVICGSLFRPLESFKRQRQRRRYLRSLERFSRVSSRRTSGDALDRHSGQTCNHDDDDSAMPVCGLCKDVEPLSHSLIQLPTYLQNGFFHDDLMVDSIPRRGSQSLVNLSKTTDHRVQMYAEYRLNGIDQCIINVTTSPPSIDDDKPKVKKSKHTKTADSDKAQKRAHFNEQFVPRYRTDIIYRGSLLKTGFLLNHSQSASCPDILIHTRRKHHNSLLTHVRNTSSVIMSRIRDALDFAIFRSPLFVLFCVHCMLFNMSYEIPYMYVADYATDLDIEVAYLGESLLLSIIGITSTFGQIVMGYIGDRPRVNRVQFYVAMTCIAGISTIVVPQLPVTFSWLASYCGVFGFFVSANFTLVTIILVELLGMDQLTNAYGFASLAEGIACLVGPPIAGWMTDATGNYDLAFYTAGVVICLSGLILLLNPCLRPCDHVAAKKTHSVSDSESDDDDELDAADSKPSKPVEDVLDIDDSKPSKQVENLSKLPE